MNAQQLPPGVCLCGAGTCNKGEAVEIRARLEAMIAERKRLNNTAFEMFYADRAAGRTTLAPEEYLRLARAGVEATK